MSVACYLLFSGNKNLHFAFGLYDLLQKVLQNNVKEFVNLFAHGGYLHI